MEQWGQPPALLLQSGQLWALPGPSGLARAPHSLSHWPSQEALQAWIPSGGQMHTGGHWSFPIHLFPALGQTCTPCCHWTDPQQVPGWPSSPSWGFRTVGDLSRADPNAHDDRYSTVNTGPARRPAPRQPWEGDSSYNPRFLRAERDWEIAARPVGEPDTVGGLPGTRLASPCPSRGSPTGSLCRSPCGPQ